MAGVGEDEGMDLSLQVHLHDGTVALHLVPRWESCPPQATGAGGDAAAVGSSHTSSSTSSRGAVLPIAPPPPETVELILPRSSLVTSIPLVSCDSKQGARELRSIEGKWYLNLEVNPANARAVIRSYEVDPEMKWKSTGVYCINLPCPKSNTVCPLESLFGNRSVYFHGKHNEEIQFPPVKLNFEANFHCVKRIGKGTEGSVHLCSSNFSKNKFAVKQVDQLNILARTVCDEPRDVSILAMLGHKNVIELHFAWSEANLTQRFGYARGSIFVAMKPCARSLKHFIQTEETNVQVAYYIFRQLMEGLAYIHQQGIAHRDIKPENILLQDDLSLKIIDFGIAKVKQSPDVKFGSGVYGSAPYYAPELHDTYSRHNEMVDIFSSGMVYYELFMPDQHRRKAKLDQLSNIIRRYAQEFDLLGRPPEVFSAMLPGDFNLGALLNGTGVIDDWLGNLQVLKHMIDPESAKRLPALQILELLDDKTVDDVDDCDGSTSCC